MPVKVIDYFASGAFFTLTLFAIMQKIYDNQIGSRKEDYQLLLHD